MVASKQYLTRVFLSFLEAGAGEDVVDLLATAGLFVPALTFAVLQHRQVDRLQFVGHRRATVGHATPAGDGGRPTDVGLVAFGQADGADVVLVDHLGLEFEQGDVVLEIVGVVVGVDLFAFDFKVLVRERLVLRPHVPLAQPHADSRW